MNKIIIVILILLLISCKSQQKNDWKTAYKANVLCSCVKNSGAKIEEDASPSINFQILGDFKIIAETGSIGKRYSDIIKERNVWYKGGDLDDYSNIVNGCLDFYNSKELEILSRKRSNKKRLKILIISHLEV
ncbi:hypothetical protein [uncultured Chryseobacterium sp.]|uniref:hypothetical protein n=1 Tax=uncultured Chryseobacterium sp. TaxID=259322 RepID=UPI0025DE96E1|nr:hypothetical protein [uncultured Chryseobacterium sp.]